MRQGVICMLIAALVLQLAGGVVAGGAEPLAMTTQETIRTVAVSGVPTALMRGARLPERMPSFHTDAACHLADSWQSWSGMVWFSSPDGEHISKPLPAGTVTEPGVYYYLGLVLEPDGLASFSDAPSVTVCGTTAAVQRLEDGRLFVCATAATTAAWRASCPKRCRSAMSRAVRGILRASPMPTGRG